MYPCKAEGSRRSIILFLALAYGASWLVEVPAALTTYGLLHVHIPRGLLNAAQFAPALAALTTTVLLFGSRSLRPLVAPLVKVRAPLIWYALVLFVPPVTQFGALLLYGALGHPMPAISPWTQLPLMILVLALFSVGEELGWRGFFLPALRRNNSPLAVAAWMALSWGLWHLPFYLRSNSEGQSTWLLYLLFLAGMPPVCAFFVLLFSRTQSLLLCMLFHGSLNGSAAYFFGPLATGELLPFALWILLLWILGIPFFIILSRESRCDAPAPRFAVTSPEPESASI